MKLKINNILFDILYILPLFKRGGREYHIIYSTSDAISLFWSYRYFSIMDLENMVSDEEIIEFIIYSHNRKRCHIIDNNNMESAETTFGKEIIKDIKSLYRKNKIRNILDEE